MSCNQVHIGVEPHVVFDVLDDACAYASWVVGTRRVRSVDAAWPAVGSQFHHAIGNAAAELHDSSKVLERDRPRALTLEVRFRPTGVARVAISVKATATGSVVTLEETPTSGPVAILPRLVTDPLLHLRNAVSLQRLRHEVERRSEAKKRTHTPG